MFQFIRRFSGSFLPRPDRPWRDDATSHAPTIGRKRRHSVIEQDRDGSASISKRTKNDIVKPDTECDSASGGGSPEGDAISPVEGQDVKGVTKGVKEVDLEDKLKVEVVSSLWPEGIPLPDSPSASPEPESESQEPESPQSMRSSRPKMRSTQTIRTLSPLHGPGMMWRRSRGGTCHDEYGRPRMTRSLPHKRSSSQSSRVYMTLLMIWR
ncbi:hypothetical protein JVT61DRAFT_8233 [Boletus reticuloceps]|uniref:Uncharacterized protein n=1 Tax=Boletus reticuloceps TaxID=495285 RepID=A0A8I3ACB8_9AGAM|nr:hypothetical protein JVT61DRAFT_8233 [Boletus reticuloceps]